MHIVAYGLDIVIVAGNGAPSRTKMNNMNKTKKNNQWEEQRSLFGKTNRQSQQRT